MIKKILAGIVLVLAMLAAVACYAGFSRDTGTAGATIEGYVKQVDPDNRMILICYDPEDISDENYLGDCCIPVEEGTVLADGRTLDSIQPGEHILATYTGTLAEVFPAEVDGTVRIEFIEAG